VFNIFTVVEQDGAGGSVARRGASGPGIRAARLPMAPRLGSHGDTWLEDRRRGRDWIVLGMPASVSGPVWHLLNSQVCLPWRID
jgi:hypothetical protein